MWLSEESYDENRIKESLRGLNIEFGNDVLVFELVCVMLIRATKQQLLLLTASVNGISEFKHYHRPSVLTQNIQIHDEEQYAQLIKDVVPQAKPPLSRIGVLDTGAPKSHILLAKYISDNRKLSAYDPHNVYDRKCHGVGMASLALYGDLADVINQPSPDPVVADLVSVKITHDDDKGQYSNKLYAIESQEAIGQARNNEASILCSAVTTPIESDSKPTSWSAAIDEALYNDGACDSMLLLSAGNVTDNRGMAYPDYLYLSPVLDPAQSWNALTVGAFTQKILLSNQNKQGASIVAPSNGISPFSRNSLLWGHNIIKPEILMEGGNAYWNNNQIEQDDDLMLIGANSSTFVHQFCPFSGTSPATALAARLASQIQYRYPKMLPLTIRALMVHSAEWTPQMINMATENGNLKMDLLIHTCGYGVPNKRKALMSDNSHVTFISEEVLQPFSEGRTQQLNFASMNLHELPWPEEILQQLGEIDSTMKITLSYYISPCPGARGRLRKYSYQSIRLNFDVIRPTENLDNFKRRVSHVVEDDDQNMMQIVAERLQWKIGVRLRNQGSVISDSFTMTSSQMAKCRYIAIYPSSGWFKWCRNKADIQIKYSLVVSLETPEQDIYTSIAQMVDITNPVEIMI